MKALFFSLVFVLSATIVLAQQSASKQLPPIKVASKQEVVGAKIVTNAVPIKTDGAQTMNKPTVTAKVPIKVTEDRPSPAVPLTKANQQVNSRNLESDVKMKSATAPKSGSKSPANQQ